MKPKAKQSKAKQPEAKQPEAKFTLKCPAQEMDKGYPGKRDPLIRTYRISALRYNEGKEYWEYQLEKDVDKKAADKKDASKVEWIPEHRLMIDTMCIELEDSKEFMNLAAYREMKEDSD